MARPHPVVGLSAELTHRCRRSAHEADVRISAVHDDVVHIVIVEARHLHAAAGVGGFGFLFQVIGLGAALLDGVRHVLHAHEEGNRETRAGNLFGKALGPVAVHQVVVLIGRESLDGTVPAVVVRDQQPLGRYHLPGASSAEVHDGIFQGSLVDGINLLRAQFAAGGFHVLSVQLLQKGQHPHSFVGHCTCRYGESGQKSDYPFHFSLYLSYKGSQTLLIPQRMNRRIIRPPRFGGWGGGGFGGEGWAQGWVRG